MSFQLSRQKISNVIFCYKLINCIIYQIYKQLIRGKLVIKSVLSCPVLSYQMLNICSILCYSLQSGYQTHPQFVCQCPLQRTDLHPCLLQTLLSIKTYWVVFFFSVLMHVSVYLGMHLAMVNRTILLSNRGYLGELAHTLTASILRGPEIAVRKPQWP